MAKKRQNASAKMDAEWNRLRLLIIGFGEASVAESWKGGGDPADHDVLSANLELSKLRMEAQITKMRREYDL